MAESTLRAYLRDTTLAEFIADTFGAETQTEIERLLEASRPGWHIGEPPEGVDEVLVQGFNGGRFLGIRRGDFWRVASPWWDLTEADRWQEGWRWTRLPHPPDGG